MFASVYEAGEKILDRFTVFDDPAAPYESLKALVAQNGTKFTDTEEFPLANTSAIPTDENEVLWKRLSESYSDAVLFSENSEAWEISQGYLGNCGTIANLCGLSVSKSEDFTVESAIYPATYEKEVGAFFVRFNYLGNLKWVLIDDYVPARNSGKPKFCKPKNGGGDGIWMCLMEKAAAKIRGCYMNLSNDFDRVPTHTKGAFGGDLWYRCTTSIVTEFEKVKAAVDGGGYGIFSFNRDAAGTTGVVTGHAFALCDYAEIPDAADQTKVHQLVWVENPWGSGHDFVSDWSDDSENWNNYPEYSHLKEKTNKSGGSYWIPWEILMQLTASVRFCVPIADFDKVKMFSSEMSENNGPTSGTGKATIRDHVTPFAFDVPTDQTISITVGVARVIPSSGSKHLYWFLYKADGEYVGRLEYPNYAWWGKTKTKEMAVTAGSYLIYPCTMKGADKDSGLMYLQIVLQ